MSKLLINTLVDLPKEVYPIEEFISVVFVVGYYVGTSFRVLCRLNDLASAKDVAFTYQKQTKRETYVYRSRINLERIV